MSYEYQLFLSDLNPGAVIDAIASALRSNSSYAVVSVEDANLKGRFSKIVEREDWVEDFQIIVSCTDVYLAIHSGSSLQRTTLVDDLSECFASIGIDAKLVEE